MQVTRAIVLLVLWLSMGVAAHADTQAAGQQEFSYVRAALNQVFVGSANDADHSAELVVGSGKLVHDSFDARWVTSPRPGA